MSTANAADDREHYNLQDLKDAAQRNPEASYRAVGYAEPLKSGSGRLVGHCPFHVDTDPSFVVFPDGGWYCFGACRTGGSIIDFYLRWRDLPELTHEAVVELARLLGVGPRRRARPTPDKPRRTMAEAAAVWEVREADGELVAVHVRFDEKGGGKSVLWWRDGSWGLDGLELADLPLYRLPELAAADDGQPAIVTEGEKAADALADRGLLAVGTVTGASGTPGTDALRPLQGRRAVYLWPDADDVGEAHMARVAQALMRLGVRPRIVTWPDAPEHGDAADFDGDDDALRELLHAAEPWQLPGIYRPPSADPAGLLEALPNEGFIRDYFDWVEPTTDAPAHFHLPAALTCVSGALGNRVYVPFGSMNAWPNLYSVLVCPSSRFRKSSVLRPARELLSHLTVTAQVGKETQEEPVVLPGEFSPEAFFQTLSERPTGVLVWGELATALAQFGRTYSAGLAEFLTECYDVPPRVERRLRHERFVIERPCFSILAATTPEWATSHMTQTTAVGGFLPRFAFFSAEEPGELLPIPPPLDEERGRELVRWLGHLRAAYPHDEPVPVSLDAVRGQYEAFARDLDASRGGGRSEALQDAFITRFGALALRLALLFEAARKPGSRALSPDSFDRAAHIVRYLRDYTAVLLDELAYTDWEQWRQRALAAIRDAGADGLKKTALTRGPLRGMEKRQRDQLLEALQEEGVVIEREGTGGQRGPRPTEYVAVEHVAAGR